MLCYINLFAISVQFKKQLSLSSLQWIKYITMQNVRFFMGGSSFVSFEYNKIPCETQQQLLKILFLMLLTNMSTISRYFQPYLTCQVVLKLHLYASKYSDSSHE